MGWAAYCLHEDPLAFDARERAYRLYRRCGDDQSAARVAAWLAADWYDFRGEPAVGECCNAPIGLAVHEASMRVEEDTAAARALAVQAVELGRRFDVPELKMVGLGLEGVALVSEGEPRGGSGSTLPAAGITEVGKRSHQTGAVHRLRSRWNRGRGRLGAPGRGRVVSGPR